MAEVIDLNPKLTTDILVRLGDDVQALGELRPGDVLAAKLVLDSTGEALSPLVALDTLIETLSLIRDETSAIREAAGA